LTDQVSNPQQRLWVSVGIGLLAVIILLFTVPSHPLVPKGIILPAKKTLSPTAPADVLFYQGTPGDNQKLGYISIELHVHKGQSPKQAESAVLDKAKALAASVGANGVVVNQFFRTRAMSTPSALALYIFNGEAVHTTAAMKPLALSPTAFQGSVS